MMTCKYGIISDYAGCTYEELLDLRAKVMDDIIAFEEEKTIEDKKGCLNGIESVRINSASEVIEEE